MIEKRARLHVHPDKCAPNGESGKLLAGSIAVQKHLYNRLLDGLTPEHCTLDFYPLQLISNVATKGTNLTYSSVRKSCRPKTTMQVKIPSKEDAIIFPVIDNTTNVQYALALIDSLQPRNFSKPSP